MVVSNAVQSDSSKSPSASRGGANPNIKQLARKHPLPEVGYRVLSDIKVKPVEWLVHGMLPEGCYTEFIGDPTVGKSYLSTKLMADFSTGTTLPFEPADVERDPCNCGFISAEDDPATTIAPRLLQAGADMDRIVCLDYIAGQYPNLGNPEHLDHIEDWINDRQLRYIVIDPIDAYLGGVDAHSNQSVRSVLGPLVQILQKTKCTLTAIRHPPKAVQKVIHAGGGSMGFTAQSRASFLVGYLDSIKHERVIVPIKTNLSEEPKPFGFTLDENGVEFTQEHPDVTAGELISRTDESNPEISKVDQAKLFLQGLLQTGPHSSSDIDNWIKQGGFAHGTYVRARDALKEAGKIELDREGGKSTWQLKQS
tara:strand:- start:13 stop:1110 length:1098 start_codon:yes stop_codon:yes gene_type:complete